MGLYAKFLIVLFVAAVAACNVVSSSTTGVDIAALAPTPSTRTAAPAGLQTAVFAGGCFWGVEAVFEHVKGVTDVRSGYSGGGDKDARYDKVSTGKTGHAEAVKVTFDPAKVNYIQLLTVFFAVAHDPTEVDRQGPDVGPQYRSEIFYADDAQRQAAEAYIDAINKSKALPKPVATKVSPFTSFFEAESYHQDYLAKNPNEPYIVMHDKPKLADLKKRFPELYKAQ